MIDALRRNYVMELMERKLDEKLKPIDEKLDRIESWIKINSMDND